MRTPKIFVTASLSLALASAGLAQSPKQTPFFDVRGQEFRQRLGSALAAVGDHDGDGAEDLLVGAPAGPKKVGRALLVSGADGSLLRTFASDVVGDRFGSSLAYAGDVNADGRPDVVVGTEGAPGQVGASARVYSGLDGALLHLFQFPPAYGLVASVGGGADVDGDGHDDLIVALPGAPVSAPPAGGVVYVFSGADGSVLHQVLGSGNNGVSSHGGANFGAQVVLMGDADGDGLSEFAIAAPFDGTVGPLAGKVTVYAGVDASVLHTFLPPTDLDLFGWSLAPAGDVDGDGRQDLAVGTPYEEKNFLFANIAQGSVRVFSGRDGSTLHRIWGPKRLDHLGTSLAAGRDVDGDGVGDLISGMPGQGLGYFPVVGGRALVISGATGGTIDIYSHAHTSFGAAVALLRDVNGDGHADPVVAAPLESSIKKDAGLVNAYVGACSSVASYCTPGTSAAGCSPSVATAGQPSATKPFGFSLTVSQVDGGSRGFVYFGTSGRQALPFRGSLQCVAPPVRFTGSQVSGGTPGSCEGALTVDLNDHWNVLRPEHNPGAGTQTQAQAFLRAGQDGQALLSGALEFTLCP